MLEKLDEGLSVIKSDSVKHFANCAQSMIRDASTQKRRDWLETSTERMAGLGEGTLQHFAISKRKRSKRIKGTFRSGPERDAKNTKRTRHLRQVVNVEYKQLSSTGARMNSSSSVYILNTFCKMRAA